MRFAVSLLALTISTQALAGGIGLVTTSGLHGEQLYFYDSSRNYTQYAIGETLMNYGGGIEILLGDRDDRFTGVMRGFYLQDAPQKHPRELTALVDPDDVVATVREEPRHIGMATVGLQWAFLGNPEGLQATAVGSLGSGFLTEDHTEFVLIELGGGVSYQFARNMRVYGNLEWGLRYRKGFSNGANAYVGVRYFFD